MGDTTYNVNVSKSELHDNAAVIRNETRASESDNKVATLQELRQQLETTANAVSALEEAMKAKNKPKIKALVGSLTSGMAKDIITAVASDALLSLIKNLK